jgi:hypothetical protein
MHVRAAALLALAAATGAPWAGAPWAGPGSRLDQDGRGVEATVVYGDDLLGAIPGTNGVSIVPVVTNADGHIEGYTTWTLSVKILGNAKNAYTLYGSTNAPLIMPAAWKCDCAPFGSDIGGTNPAFWPFKQEAQWDSWLTVGVTDGNSDGAITTIGMSDQWSKWCAVTPGQTVPS